jgi:phosphoenolpyruvate carboxylase
VVSAKYANRGTAHYQTELLAASVLQHVLMSEREDALLPRHEFDEAMEALSGVAWASYRTLMETPALLAYLRGSSPLEELSLLNIGSRPARRQAGPGTLADLRAIPWVFAWTQNRHMVPGWYGLGSALEAFVEVRKARGLALLQRMFEECRLFRTVIDEVEKTLLTVDMSIAAEYTRLVPDAQARDSVFRLIEAEYERTCARVLEVTDGGELAERFPQYRRRLGRRLQTMNQVSREQVQLLQRVRDGGDDEVRTALLLSIRCAAAGFGATG